MKTLLVGDLHLKESLILPIVKEKAKEFDCKRIVMLGDYTDTKGQDRNPQLYFREIGFLKKWKYEMEEEGVEVINLIGNHDVSYLTDEPRHYSLTDFDGFIFVKESLFELGIRVAFWLGKYLVSHAGYAAGNEAEDWHFNYLYEEDAEKLMRLSESVGFARGGIYLTGSPLWADYDRELTVYPHEDYPYQIVGHSPRKEIDLGENYVGIDTFLVYPYKGLRNIQYGNGSLLLHDDWDDSLKVVLTRWNEDYGNYDFEAFFMKGDD